MKIPIWGGGTKAHSRIIAWALVDSEDFIRYGGYRWNLHTQGYAYRKADGRNEFLHRRILGLKAGDRRQVDHKNRNRLDCHKRNLRMATHALNRQNQNGNPKGSSQYRGVYWDKRRKKWCARIQVSGRVTFLGYFESEIKAARIARNARKEMMPYALS